MFGLLWLTFYNPTLPARTWGTPNPKAQRLINDAAPFISQHLVVASYADTCTASKTGTRAFHMDRLEGVTTYAVIYDYDADSEDIVNIRPRHREFLGQLKEEGKLIGSGPFTDGEGDALIVIRLADDSTLDDAYALMDQDPFWVENALNGRTIHTWNPVINIWD